MAQQLERSTAPPKDQGSFPALTPAGSQVPVIPAPGDAIPLASKGVPHVHKQVPVIPAPGIQCLWPPRAPALMCTYPHANTDIIKKNKQNEKP